MMTFYLHDGQNEAGPFTLDELKKQKLTRNTPLRQRDTDKWMPAEKLAELKPLVAPRKIRRPKDVVPVVAQTVADLHQRKPLALYGGLLAVALVAGITIYKVKKQRHAAEAEAKTSQAKPAAAVVAAGNTVVAKDSAVKSIEGLEKQSRAIEPPKADAAKATRLRWNKLIKASNSNYGIGLLGGIKDLSVIVSNNSDYPLDEVVVKLTYVKANGEVWKTVPVTLNSIPAHEGKEQSVSDVGRAKKVKVAISRVVSHKMKFNYNEGKKGKDPGDPYFQE